VEATSVTTAADLAGAYRVILPGVGAFDHAMERLEASGMREVLDDLVLRRRVPVLGVCVGMQILAHDSEEGERAGLRYVDARVRQFEVDAPTGPLQLPHMGWNDVDPVRGNPLFEGLEDDARFYFLHSYYFECRRPDDVAAVSTYGREFSCAVTAGNIHGVQFHPEKSHHFGTRLLQNFAER
jgi:glutamine amidotransferase